MERLLRRKKLLNRDFKDFVTRWGRELDRRQIGYTKIENASVRMDDWKRAQKISGQFRKTNWKKFLARYAKLVNSS
jgi:hypothetical protein